MKLRSLLNLTRNLGAESSGRASLRINAASNIVAFALNVVVGFFLTPIIIRCLGKTDFGIWTLVASFVGYYGLLNLGVGSAIVRYVARFTAQKDEAALSATASTAMTMFTVTGLLVALLSFLVANPLASFFRVGQEHLSAFEEVVRIVGLATALSFSDSVLRAVLVARERFVAVNAVACVLTLIRAALSVLVLHLGYGLSGVAYVLLVESALEVATKWFLCRRLAPEIRVSFKLANRPMLRMLLLYGGATTVITVGDLIRSNLDSFVVGKWVGLAQVGVYGIGLMLVRYMVRVVTTAMSVLTPRFANLDGAGEEAKVRALFLRALSFSAILSFGCGMGAMLFGGHLITLWVGRDFSESTVILRILAISSAFAVAQNPAIGLMYAMNKHHYYAVATITEAAANLALSLVLVQRYGIVGVALGTMVPMLVVKVLAMPVYVSRIAGITVGAYIRPLTGPALVAGTITLAGYLLGFAGTDLPPLHHLAAMMILTAVAYVGVCYLFLASEDQAALAKLVSRPSTRTEYKVGTP
jgi:O-antigen/teichoic acid export membrane protein